MRTIRSSSGTAGALAACVAAFVLTGGATPADQDGPMQRVARSLGTPKVGYTARNDAHTNSMIEFVRTSETVDNWTKMFTVVATRVDVARTQDETKATILRLRKLVAQKHANLSAFDVRESPAVAYFKYALGDEVDVGVVFSPIPGVVTVQQVASRRSGTITAHDVGLIKGLVGYPG